VPQSREREQAARQRDWEAAIDQATRQLVDDLRREVLRRCVDAWKDAEAIRDYCDAVEARHGPDLVAAEPSAPE
jgi:hypothetical protein